ncbi:MAG TPA: hypothetical protein PKU70_06270 [Vicinamibacteria bacterium]|nr:hypothetical protein [Vicinamibacteria bacterium]
MRRTTILTLVALSAACGSKPAPPPPPVAVATPVPTPAPPAVSGVTLGNAIGADKAVATAAETFAVKDTIYASVATTGAGHFKLRALWSFVKGDKTAKVNETTIEFDSTGSANNEFHVENAKGWPKGDYKVDIFLGDAEAPATTKTFKVQ